MKRSIFLVLAMVTLLISCNTDFKKTKSGVVYKIIHKGKGGDPLIKTNDIIKYHITEKWNDSLLGTSYGKMPQYFQLPPSDRAEYSPLEVFPMMRKGDSAIIVLSIDSLMKSGMAQMQFPYAKKGDRLTLTYKILEVFHNDSTANADARMEQEKDAPRRQKEMEEEQRKREAEMNTKKVEEAKEIEDWLAARNIKTTKTEKGVYIQMLQPGNGQQADSGKYVSFDYTGKSFEGKVFDSSIDTSFHHQTISYIAGGGMAPGVDDGIRHLKKGAHAILYIPAALGYGPNAINEQVGPWSNLIFDIYIRDVKDAPPAPPVTKKPEGKADNGLKKK